MYYITDTDNHVLMADDYSSAEFLFNKLENCNVSYVEDYKGPAILYVKHPVYSRTNIYKPVYKLADTSLIHRHCTGILSYKLKYTIYKINDHVIYNESSALGQYTLNRGVNADNSYEHLIDLEDVINRRYSSIRDIVISNDDDEIVAELSHISASFPVLTLYRFMSLENLNDILYVYDKVLSKIGSI